MSDHDNEIIEKIRLGDKRPYGVLVDRYKDKAMTLAMRMLRNRQDAEEATQDAFVRGYKGLNRFEGEAKFSTWFYRILYNVCLTRIGKRKEEFHTIDYEEDQEYTSLTGNLSDSPLSSVETLDLVEHVSRIMRELPEHYSTILSLFYLQQLSHAEICEVTELPLGTVKVRLFRARAMLQERLTKEFQEEKLFT